METSSREDILAWNHEESSNTLREREKRPHQLAKQHRAERDADDGAGLMPE